MPRLRPLASCLAVCLGLAALAPAETLYNGIVLPSPWPPPNQMVDERPTPTPPYLISPPEVIPIDVGRQLFVDNFLVEKTDLRRTPHYPEPYAGNPVLRPDQPWETLGQHRTAMAFSDGIWYDPKDQYYKAWYQAGGGQNWLAHNPYTCLARSIDGVHWEKPLYDVVPGTNVVLVASRDSSTVWLDLEETDPNKRFKLVYSHGGVKPPASLHYSADGIHWGKAVADTPETGDRITFFRNPFRQVWVMSLRVHSPEETEMGRGLGRYGKDKAPFKLPGERVRFRGYHEGATMEEAVHWNPAHTLSSTGIPNAGGDVLPWVGADRLDGSRIDLAVRPELYALDGVAYESLIVGLFTVWRGQPDHKEREKPNQPSVGFSRDGFHWSRPFRRPFVQVSEDPNAWNYGNIQSTGGICLVVGDRLYFYASGRHGGGAAPGENATGLFTLRRDGFVSLDAPNRSGALTTRPVRFSGKRLFVNVDSSEGELTAEILDQGNRVIAPFSRDHCDPVSVDNTLQEVRWKGAPDLSALAGTPVKLRFYLRDGRLYSFWVSPDASGASHGYVAAGGPGFTASTDTVGAAIYKHGFKQKTLD